MLDIYFSTFLRRFKIDNFRYNALLNLEKRDSSSFILIIAVNEIATMSAIASRKKSTFPFRVA